MRKTLIQKLFNDHLAANLENSLNEQSFTDVTIVSDDQVSFQAHKVIMSIYSPVIRIMLVNNPHSHPIVYLRNVEHHEVQAILNFMYFGKIQFVSERKCDLVRVVKDLQIKKLDEALAVHVHTTENDEIITNTSLPENESSKFSENSVISFDNYVENGSDTGGTRPSRKPHECEVCGSRFTTLYGMQGHKRAKHDGIRFACSYCDYKATTRSHLKKHEQSVHEGVRYPCDKCGYQSSTRQTLKKHQESIHDGIKFSCDLCQFQAGDKSTVKRHKLSKHSY